jgi:hypothetical protein
VAAAFGAQCANAGWLMTVNALNPGAYTLVAFAHSELTGSFDVLTTRHVSVLMLQNTVVESELHRERHDFTSPGVQTLPNSDGQ